MLLIFIGFGFAWISGHISANPSWLATIPFASRPFVRRLATIGSAIVGGSLVLASMVT